MPLNSPVKPVVLLSGMKSKFLSAGNLLNLGSNVAIATYLALLTWHVTSMYLPSLRMAWFTSSDENVLVAEVIRFSNLDFYQRFFDMPGTPLMLLGAIEWRLYFFFANLMHSSGAEMNEFTFQHLQQLFNMLRVDSLVFFIISGLLLFRIVSKATNKYAGAAATTLLLMNQPYEGTVPFIRVEPLAMCLMLAAILVLTETKSLPGAFAAGLLCGIGAACRLHSITASLPVLGLLLIFRDWGSGQEYSRAFGRLVAGLGAVALAVSLALAYFFAWGHAQLATVFPLAFGLFAKASLASAILIALLGAAYLFPATRPLVWKTVTPASIILLAGVGLGLVLGVPTAIIRYDAFLQSVDFYQSPQYYDPVAAHLPLFEKIASLFRFYVPRVLPDWAAAILFLAGASLILIFPRWRRLTPYLIVALAFFVSRPLGLLHAPHHVALWAPFYAIVCSVAFAAFTGLFETKNITLRYLTAAIAIATLFWLRMEMPDSSGNLKATMAGHIERTRNVALFDAWLSSQGDNASTVMVTFYCFDQGIFYNWYRTLGLFVPRAYDAGPREELWWGNQSALKARSGLACLSNMDLPVLKEWELRQRGEGLDPLHDSRFHLIQSFGHGLNQVDVMQFDFR